MLQHLPRYFEVLNRSRSWFLRPWQKKQRNNFCTRRECCRKQSVLTGHVASIVGAVKESWHAQVRSGVVLRQLPAALSEPDLGTLKWLSPRGMVITVLAVLLTMVCFCALHFGWAFGWAMTRLAICAVCPRTLCVLAMRRLCGFFNLTRSPYQRWSSGNRHCPHSWTHGVRQSETHWQNFGAEGSQDKAVDCSSSSSQQLFWQTWLSPWNCLWSSQTLAKKSWTWSGASSWWGMCVGESCSGEASFRRSVSW